MAIKRKNGSNSGSNGGSNNKPNGKSDSGVLCEIEGCDKPHTAVVCDFIQRENLSTGKMDIDRYGEPHFYCSGHIRMSVLLPGHPKTMMVSGIDYYWDQFNRFKGVNVTKHVGVRRKRQSGSHKRRQRKKRSIE